MLKRRMQEISFWKLREACFPQPGRRGGWWWSWKGVRGRYSGGGFSLQKEQHQGPGYTWVWKVRRTRGCFIWLKCGMCLKLWFSNLIEHLSHWGGGLVHSQSAGPQPQSFWFSQSGKQQEYLHFLQGTRWCLSCRPRDPTLRTAGLADG